LNGLTDEEVVESRKKYGSNNVDLKNENKFIKLFFDALGDPIIKIMLIALAIRFILMFRDADWYETLGMLISILLSSLISSLSEYGSNKAFARLQSEYENIMVRVKRNNELTTVKCDDLVVGDIVYLESGEMTPADGVIIEGAVGVDEASINGEAKEVRKEKNAKLFKGSVILSDKCIMRIKNVGVNTIYGNIAKELNEKVPDSPMKIRLRKLAKIVSRIGYIGAILASLSYIFNVLFISNNFDIAVISEILKNPIEVFDIIIHTVTLAVTIIIVCVPEGLPMMLALVLSSNMKRMLKNNVLVRKPVGIETSGSISVLLTDKTGTLTKGKLSVIGIVDANDNHYNNLSEMNSFIRERFSESLLYNNDSYFEGNKITSGNSTDKAILSFIGKREKTLSITEKTNFNSTIKYSYVKLSNGSEYYKGASEVLLDKCRFYIDKNGDKKYLTDKKKIQNIITNYTKRGIRVICDVYNNALLGFILIRDDIRSEANDAIKEIKEAGIDIIMITGDDVNTATSIAQELNMLDNELLHQKYIHYLEKHIELCEKEVKRIMPLVEKINGLEEKIAKLSDSELKAKTEEFKHRLQTGETLDDLLPEAFATVREASKRVLGMRHFDVQLIGGIILHQGRIAEMKTGEGKTLVATLPVYLNALSGKGVHVVTVND